MSQPEVSIITLTYNHAKYIAECLDSVYRQSFQSWEQIIIDDGSTDGTWDIIQQYVQKDSRFRAYQQEHVGPFRMVETYNRALFHATGKLIAILEGDDSWPPHKLKTQTGLHEPGIIFSYGRTLIIDENNSIIRPYSNFEWDDKPLPAQKLRMELLCRQAGIMPVSVMLDRDTLLSIGGFRSERIAMPDGSFCIFPSADYATFIRYLFNDGYVRRSNDVLGHWRQHTTQTTHVYENIFHEGAFQLALQGLYASRERNKYKHLYRSHRKFASGFYLNVLRSALMNGDKIRAKMAIRRLLWWGGSKRRLEAIYGFLALLVGMNMEIPFALYEKILAVNKGED